MTIRMGTLSTIMLLLACLPSFGQSPEPGDWLVTPFAQGSARVGNPNLGRPLGIGLAVARTIAPRVAVEGELSYVPDAAGEDSVFANWSMMHASANAVYRIGNRRVRPYGTVGLTLARNRFAFRGQLIDDPTLLDELRALGINPASPEGRAFSEAAVNVGGGVKYPITSRILARADLRRFEAFDAAPDHWRVYGGVSFPCRLW